MNSEELIIRNEELGIRNKYRLISPLISVMNVVNVAKGVWGLVNLLSRAERVKPPY